MQSQLKPNQPMKKTLLIAASITFFVPAAMADEIIAVSWPTGIYKVDSVTGVGQSVGSPPVEGLNSLARSLAGVFYSVASGTNLVVINPTDGSATTVATLQLGGASVNVPSMAFSPSGVLYVINRDGGDSLYTVNINTGEGTLVGSTVNRILQGLAFAPNGTLYGWDINAGLFTVNTTTGLATDVSFSEGASAQIQCLAFAPDGTLYGAQDGLFTIDTTTGVPSTIVATGLSDIRGMEFNTGPVLHLSIARVSNGVRICCLTETNKTYQLQFRQNADSTNAWTNLGPVTSGTGEEVCLTNNVNAGRRFYQMVATPL